MVRTVMGQLAQRNCGRFSASNLNSCILFPGWPLISFLRLPMLISEVKDAVYIVEFFLLKIRQNTLSLPLSPVLQILRSLVGLI